MAFWWLFVPAAILVLQLIEAQVYTSTNGTYIGVKIKKTFYEAERYCQVHYGTKLASIHSFQQQNEIYNVAQQSATSYAWIGLTDEYHYGHFYWTNGQPYNFSEVILPSTTNIHCWTLRTFQTNVWARGKCNEEWYFICNGNAVWTQPLDLTFMAPINALATSTDGSLTLFNHTATFTEADAYCQRMLGTHLASITNYEQSEQAQELCSKTAQDTLCWIGLTQMFQNGYEWTDGSDIGYYRWGYNADLSYDCGAIKSNGQSTIYSWTTNHCLFEEYKTIFICSTYPPTVYPTHTPTKRPTTNNPTTDPTTAPTISPYIMIPMNGSYLCSELSQRIAIFYDITYDECIAKCKYDYGATCEMVNYRQDTVPSRCYIFDKQCTINKNNNGDSSIAFVGFKHFCVDYPLDWNDINGDTCYAYTDTNVLGYCNNESIAESIAESISVSEIESKATLADFNALETCCECGGGAELFDDITMTFGQIQENEYDLLCEWNYGNPVDSAFKTWDNIVIYNLCQRLKKRINSNVDDIDCNQLIDASYSGDITFISCDFNDYDTNNDDLYFLFMINKDIAASSVTIYINSDWFQLTQTLLPKTLSSWSYSQCIASLWSAAENNLYVAVPCEGDVQTQTMTTTSKSPTNSPSFIPSNSLSTTKVSKVTSLISTLADSKDLRTKTTSTTEMEVEYNSTNDEESDSNVIILLVLNVGILWLVVIVVLVYMCRQKTQKNGNKQIAHAESTESEQLRLQMSNLNHNIIVPTHTPTDDEVNDDLQPLPNGWVKVFTDDKRVYYQNNTTKQTQWQHPLKK